MKTIPRSYFSAALAATAVAVALVSGACAHRRPIYESNDFARRPIIRPRVPISKAPAVSRLTKEPKLARVVDERDDPPAGKQDEADDERD